MSVAFVVVFIVAVLSRFFFGLLASSVTRRIIAIYAIFIQTACIIIAIVVLGHFSGFAGFISIHILPRSGYACVRLCAQLISEIYVSSISVCLAVYL